MLINRFFRSGSVTVALSTVMAAGLFTLMSVAASQSEPRVIELGHSGRTLLANLNEAAGKDKDTSVILMVHGTFAHKDMELMGALQTALDERGVHSLAVSLSYLQDSRKGPRDCKLPVTDTYFDGRKEIDAWFRWLAGEGFSKIVLLGHSRGGARVADYLLTKGKKDALNGAVLLAPATEKPGRFEREFRGSFSGENMTAFKSKLAKAKADEMFDLPGFLYCRKSRASAAAIRSYFGEEQVRDTPTLLDGIKGSDTRVLVVAAGADEVIKGLPEAMKPLTGAANIDFKTVEDADHLFLEFYAEDAADMIAEFATGTGGN